VRKLAKTNWLSREYDDAMGGQDYVAHHIAVDNGDSIRATVRVANTATTIRLPSLMVVLGWGGISDNTGYRGVLRWITSLSSTRTEI